MLSMLTHRKVHQMGVIKSSLRRNLAVVLTENGAIRVLTKVPSSRLENRSLGAEIDRRSDVYAAW